MDDCFQSQLALRYQLPLCSHALYHSLVPDSDSLYHRLFAHPRMVEGLVREFVPRTLVAGLDFSGLQRVNPKFHVGRRSARRRESDVIWRLPTRDGSNIYLYLLIEFQSENDGWMAVRTQVYQGLLWQQVIDEQKLQAGARLPPLLLLVLYNGERRWKAATTTGELIALSPDSALWPWQPQVRYHLLDMGAFPKDELARRSSLVALLFRLEQRHSPGDLQELLDEVIGWFRQHEGYERLQGLFAELVREIFAGRGMKLSESGSLSQMKTMLSTQFEAWKEQWLAEGEAKGKAEALICLLAERFGAVAPSWQKRIRGAKLVTLERWFKRAIVAPDLPSVFNPPR
jgi:Putative transposase, YhgA-like